MRAGDKLYDTYAKNVKHRNFYANLGAAPIPPMSAPVGSRRADAFWPRPTRSASLSSGSEWLERAIQSAISHLHRQCAAEGGWAGSTWRQH